MSKLQLKKELQRLTKEQLIEIFADLYDTYKPVKEYFKTRLNPENIEDLFEKYKTVIINEFYPTTRLRPKMRFSVARSAIADFNKLKPPPKFVAGLMFTLVEYACKFTNDYGSQTEQYYISALNNYERALKFLQKENLLDEFKSQCEKCLEYAKPNGYFFPDDMNELFEKYYRIYPPCPNSN